MKKRCFTTLAFAQILFAAQLASAQTVAEETSLDPITVTSSLIEKRSSETGRNITIVKGEAFAELPVHSVDELLKYVPGIEIQARGPQGSQSDITLRGGTFQQVLVIIDGIRVNDPNTGHFSSYIPIVPAQIDRIEVLKGASSAIYGSDAVGGVINIITKSFSAAKQHKNTLQAQVSAGGYNYKSLHAGGFLQKNNFSADAGVLTNHSDGVAQRGIRGYFHNTSAAVGLKYLIHPYFHIAYRAAYDTRDFAAQNFYTTFASDTASEVVNSWWHQLRAGYEKGSSKVTLDAGYKFLQDEFLFTPHATPNNNKSTLLQSQLTYHQQVAEGSAIVTGFSFQQKSINSNDRGMHTINVAAPFISLVQHIGAYMMIQPSARLELIGKNKPELIPQLTFSYKHNDLQLRASGGKTIRDADFTERYNNYNKTQVKSGRIGNPGLLPERAWNYEAGADWFYKSKLKVSGTFFQRFHTKLIDWINTPYANMPRKDNLVTNGVYALAKNISEVNTTGFESDIQYSNRISEKQNMQINAGLIWLYSKTSEAQTSFYINSHARFIGNFMALYNYGPVALSLTGIYKTRQPQEASAINAYVSKDYFLLNARASYSILQNKLAAFVQADNVFDRTYSDLLGTPMPGRWLQGGISFKM